MASALLTTAATAALLAVLPAALAGCDSGEPAADPVASPTSTPLAQVATETVVVARDAFCERVAPAAVESALSGAPDATESWSNGERARLAPGLTDVAHEYGCAWTAGKKSGRTAARAWVFAPPVTAAQADDLRRAASRVHGCEPLADAPGFGTHDVALRCATDDAQVAAFHGLFGDAWLSCTLQAPATSADLLERAEQWCATVLAAASA